ncbi:MAG: glutamine synthetase beta-grasp domain-containing protein, partial [Candidatus Omnitrophica bacterium]|nr:glutamine synthetase beta-grasp domain-containing protein [Candidatus Omnitrophota bacterium]
MAKKTTKKLNETKENKATLRWNGGVNQNDIKKVTQLIQENNIEIVDLKFNDLPGLWQHFSIPATELSEIDDPVKSIWAEGIGFDGSSIRGFQKIQESDMILQLDPSTAVVDPACEVPTLSILCDIYDPITKKAYSRDPRYVAKKAAEYLRSTGIADTSYWGPEMEFFIFNDIR